MARGFLLWVWQLPQNLLGLVALLVIRPERRRLGGIGYWHFKPDTWLRRRLAGASLGAFIIAPESRGMETLVRHEWGHCLQSRLLGPLYLLAIGLPSLAGLMRQRFFQKNWSPERRYEWYYSLPWERDADRRAGVERKFRAGAAE